ncbi:MAG: SOS response-associated peptidase [Bacteroidota bacterium]
MCGRASLTKMEKELEKRFRATFYREELERHNPLPNFNIAPTHLHPVVTANDQEHLQLFRWGLIPFWSKAASIGSRMINARIETILEKSAFRQAIRKRRCLVPFDGFYEWQKRGKQKTPYRIKLKSDQIFAVAGIWEKWVEPSSGNEIHSFSVITQPPNQLLAPIHDRMPAILLAEQETTWLDEDLPAEEALQLIVPFPDELMTAYPVSKRVNKVSENDASLIEEVPTSEEGQQGSLF